MKEAGLKLHGADTTMDRSVSEQPDVVIRTYYENCSTIATFVMVNVHFHETAALSWFSVKLIDFLQAQKVQSITHVGALRLRKSSNPLPSVFCTKSTEFTQLWNSDWTIEDPFLSRLMHFASVADIQMTLLESEGYKSPNESSREETIEKISRILQMFEFQIEKKFQLKVFPPSRKHSKTSYDLLYN